MENIGIKIKTARKKHGLTQDELAKRVGLSKYAIAKYEQGQREPNLATLTKIIDELELDFWEVCSNKNLNIEAAKPYEEGIKFADEVCHRVNRKKLAKEWLDVTPKEEIIYEFLKENSDLNIPEKLMKIQKKEYAKKHGIVDQNEWHKVHLNYMEIREVIYIDMVESILETIEFKMKVAEEFIKRYEE